MSVRKRNEYLDQDESDHDIDAGYDSDANQRSRGDVAGRASKRRRLERFSDDESFDGSDRDAAIPLEISLPDDGVENVGETGLADGSTDVEREAPLAQQPKSILKAPTPKSVANAQKAAHRSGVVYISRVPPFMKPQALKRFLTPHASKGIGRIFLTPEDPAAHTRRVRSGGNKKKSFTDGWVEFTSKNEAKIAAETLNGNIIGGKKGNFYHDDLWNMKYLKGFKWTHLTEQISNENAERAARMREEVRKNRQENKAFAEDVERGKMLEGMETKRKAKQARGGPVDGSDVVRFARPEKDFKQKAAQKARGGEETSLQASRMQKMIF